MDYGDTSIVGVASPIYTATPFDTGNIYCLIHRPWLLSHLWRNQFPDHHSKPCPSLPHCSAFFPSCYICFTLPHFPFQVWAKDLLSLVTVFRCTLSAYFEKHNRLHEADTCVSQTRVILTKFTLLQKRHRRNN